MSAEKAGLRDRLLDLRFQPSFSLESTLLGQFRLAGLLSVYVEIGSSKKGGGLFLGDLLEKFAGELHRLGFLLGGHFFFE